MPKHLLIDGDIIAFTIACRCTEAVDWDGDGRNSEHADLERIEYEVTQWLKSLKRKLNADLVTICLSDPSRRYFRHDCFADYKLDRTQGSPPKVLPTIKQLMRTGIDGFTSKWVNTLEADDVMGIIATHPTLGGDGWERIIASSDKDLKQIPATYYNVRTDKTEVVTKGSGDFFFWLQCLTGDPTDGYPGCYRIGPKKAEKIVLEALALNADGSAVWPAIVAAYERAGQDEEYALSQARCARILQWTDYDFKQKRVKLWTPC